MSACDAVVLCIAVVDAFVIGLVAGCLVFRGFVRDSIRNGRDVNLGDGETLKAGK